MGWDGRASSGIWVGNPIGWIYKMLILVFLYKDNGIRSLKKRLSLWAWKKNSAFIEVAENLRFLWRNPLLNIIPEEQVKRNLQNQSQVLLFLKQNVRAILF